MCEVEQVRFGRRKMDKILLVLFFIDLVIGMVTVVVLLRTIEAIQHNVVLSCENRQFLVESRNDGSSLGERCTRVLEEAERQ